MVSQKGHLEIAKLLVEKGAVVDQPANDGDTALTQASLCGHLEVVDFLLSAGANINHEGDRRENCKVWLGEQFREYKVTICDTTK